MKQIKNPEFAPSNCDKCGCGLSYFNDDSGLPLAKCNVCKKSFYFDYKLAESQFFQACGCIAVFVFIMFLIIGGLLLFT